MSLNLLCLDCVQSEVYNNVEDLKAHIASDHLNSCPYECEKCKYAKFPTEYALVSHCQNDHGLLEFSIKYRYTPELKIRRRELADKIQRCLALSHSVIGEQKISEAVSSTMVKMEDSDVTSSPMQSSSPGTFLESPSINSYQAFLDEALSRHEEEKSDGGSEGGGPMRKSKQIQCLLCGDVVSRQRSSMVYHANTRHGKYELYECGICHRKWQTIAKSDVIKHIKSHHEQPDGTVDLDMVIDYRKNLGTKLKEITEKCFPERKKKRIGYTDAQN
ncbi:unnamed protein product [Caenorhabditis sp. 36 PRJEB53466]|nr:unnamed protein product [Caenorhabditis sp. 36 PRJEB53466]